MIPKDSGRKENWYIRFITLCMSNFNIPDYVDYDKGHYALVSAAVIDSVINGTSYRCDDSYSEWIETLNEFDLTPLKQKAIQAIDSVLSHHSELNELWAENEELYTSWRNDKLGIQKRLIK